MTRPSRPLDDDFVASKNIDLTPWFRRCCYFVIGIIIGAALISLLLVTTGCATRTCVITECGVRCCNDDGMVCEPCPGRLAQPQEPCEEE